MAPSEALIDTNLLVLLVVGSVDSTLITRFKRTIAYSREDFELLAAELSAYNRIITTPTVLAETSNHLGQLRSPAREFALAQLHRMVSVWQEHYRESESVMGDADYRMLGLTDAAICEAAVSNRTVLTDDFGLYLALSRRGASVVNFTHLRSARLGL